MKAWELLYSPDKWAQGAMVLGRFSYFCIGTAIDKCYAEDPAGHTAAYQKIVDFLRLKNGNWDNCNLVIQWNDEPNRTWTEVHCVLHELDI